MTEKQLKFFYLPAWRRAWALNWVGRKGVVSRQEGAECMITEVAGEALVDYLAKVEGVAAGLAAERGCKADERVFRHACHLIALGHTRSAKELPNREVERVVWLFRLLADPEDLDAVVGYFNPENDARKHYLWFLEKRCVGSYVALIAGREFGTANLHELSNEQLHDLVRTLKNRPNGQRPVPAPAAVAVAAEDCPF
jgi:hypothetical protein